MASAAGSAKLVSMDPPSMDGLVMKRKTGTGWKERHLVLRDQDLAYYDKKQVLVRNADSS
eukprot:SAG31_NODE_5550_length_2464_cov_4.620296_1_plen_60_part_00